jgi:plasmid maintenance system antidote protein VapI
MDEIWKESRTKIAKEFGVSQPTISEIVHKRTWSHLV